MTLLAVNVVLALACGGIAARLGRTAGESGATTLTRAGLGAAATVIVVEEALGACGMLGAKAIGLALGALLLLLALVAHRRVPFPPSPSPASWTALEAGMLASLVVALGTRLWDALHRTTFLYDTLSYHLHAPATWLADGRVSIVPAVFGDPAPAYAPGNVELLFAFLMAPTWSGALAQAGQVPLAALACAAVAATVREARGTRAAALGAALAFLFVPEVWQQATSAMTDIGAAAFFLATLPFATRLARSARARLVAPSSMADALALGAAAGLCAGTKVVGAVFVLPLTAVAALVAARLGRRAPRAWAALAFGAFTTGAFFYARNLVTTGNPLFPLALKLGALRVPGVYDATVLRSSVYHVARTDLAALGALLLEPGISFAAAAAVTLTLGARTRPATTGLALALLALFWLALPYQESRFLFPLWGVAAIAMGAFARTDDRGAAVAWTWTPLALGVVGSAVEQPTAERWAVLGAGVAVGASFGGFPRLGRGLRFPALVVGGALGTVLMLAFAPARPAAFVLGDELDDAWAWFGANVRGARVAYTGNNLPFPLAGDGLVNDVRYVNIAGGSGDLLHDFARRVPYAPAGPEPAPYRDGARYDAWLANLRATRREVLFVAALTPDVQRTIAADADGFPVERSWADAHPDVFALRFASPAARVYGVAP